MRLAGITDQPGRGSALPVMKKRGIPPVFDRGRELSGLEVGRNATSKSEAAELLISYSLVAGRRAQLTVFIIIGVVVLAAVGGFLYVSSALRERAVEASLPPEVRLASASREVQSMVTACIDEVAPPLVAMLAGRGGRFEPASDIFVERLPVTVFCSRASSRDCVFAGPFRVDMERELAGRIGSALDGCVDFASLRRKGFDVSESPRSVRVVVGEEDVVVSVDGEVDLSLGGSRVRIADFSSRVPFPLGRLYALAVDITNQEIREGFFDKDDWMARYGAEVVIERHRPYPDVVYTLSKRVRALGRDEDFVFNFALEGRETVNLELPFNGQSNPCFTAEDGLCYQNVPPPLAPQTPGNLSGACVCPTRVLPQARGCCVSSSGACSLSSASECDGSFTEGDLLCQSSPCPNLHCQRPTSFQSRAKRHGESWCVYDGLVTNGQDYRGSRQYLHSCVNGVEVVEECRDYREELCTEETVDRSGERYSRAACRVNRWADCASQTSQSACLDRSKRDCGWTAGLWIDRKCHPAVSPGFRFWNGEGAGVCSIANEDGLGSPFFRSFGHSAAVYCQRMGDCGHYRNIADVLTKYGWSHPLDTSRLQSFVYQPAGLTARGTDFIIDLGVADRAFDPSVPIPQSPRTGRIRCLSWRAPFGGDSCSLCSADAQKPCTEYRCRSLGQSCVFAWDKGEGTCTSVPAGRAARVEINPKILTEGFDIEESADLYCPGESTNEVVQPVESDVPFSFGVVLSEPARCVASVIPPCLPIDPSVLFGGDTLGPGSLPDIALSDGQVAQEHTVSLSFPSPNLSHFDAFQLYVSCVSPEGYVNARPFSIRLKVVDAAEDTRPPSVVGWLPEGVPVGANISFTVFVSEPVKECRYGFADSDYLSLRNTNCPPSQVTDMNFVPVAPLGSYPCEFNLSVPSDVEKLYVRCQDVRGLVGSPLVYNFTR